MSQTRVLIRTLRTRSQTPEKHEERMKRIEIVDCHAFTPDCLKVHNVTPGYRARMVDWICEITSAFKLSNKTFFISVKIMDKYFQSQSTCIHSSLLHIIGMISVFIGSKLEDVEALSLKTMHERIGHSKFSLEDLLTAEQAILKKLGFLVNFITRYDLIEELCLKLSFNEEVKSLALYFSKLSLYFYEHLHMKESQIAMASLIVAGKVMNNNEVLQKVLQKLKNSKNPVNFETFYSEVSAFHKMFPSLKSIFKTSGRNFELLNGKIVLVN
jgi:hypothetical protein